MYDTCDFSRWGTSLILTDFNISYKSLFESRHGEILQLFFDALLSSSDLRKNEKNTIH